MDPEQTDPKQELPAELILTIAELLDQEDLACLAQVSRVYNKVVTPVLWKHLEFHRPPFHWNQLSRRSKHWNDTQDYPRTQTHFKCINKEWEDTTCDCMTYDFIEACSLINYDSIRWEQLAANIRTICITVNYDSPKHCWDILASLPKVESLKVFGSLNAEPSKMIPEFNIPSHNNISGNLRNIRLRGYIPSTFAYHILSTSQSTITHLDLGALEPPQRSVEDCEHDHDEAGNPWRSRSRRTITTPRALSWYPICRTSPPLTEVTHLTLCKPGKDVSQDIWCPVQFDSDNETQIIAIWSSILRAAHGTLEDFTLDIRPVKNDEEFHPIDDNNEESPYEPTSSSENFGNDYFIDQVLSIFFDESLRWPRLRRITLRGLGLPFNQSEPSRFSTRFPHVEVTAIDGNFMYVTNAGVIHQWPDADGLLGTVSGAAYRSVVMDTDSGNEAEDESD